MVVMMIMMMIIILYYTFLMQFYNNLGLSDTNIIKNNWNCRTSSSLFLCLLLSPLPLPNWRVNTVERFNHYKKRNNLVRKVCFSNSRKTLSHQLI